VLSARRFAPRPPPPSTAPSTPSLLPKSRVCLSHISSSVPSDTSGLRNVETKESLVTLLPLGEGVGGRGGITARVPDPGWRSGVPMSLSKPTERKGANEARERDVRHRRRAECFFWCCFYCRFAPASSLQPSPSKLPVEAFLYILGPSLPSIIDEDCGILTIGGS